MARAATKAEDITKKMMLGKATVDKIEDIKEDANIVKTVGNLTKPRMAAMLVMYGNTVRVKTDKDTLRFGFIFTFNALRILKNSTVV